MSKLRKVIRSSSRSGAAESDHPLTGLWIALLQRTGGNHPTFNLSAYGQRPLDPKAARNAMLTGFASVENSK
jgi:hypothetical protein